jgi:hypothetical protein
LKYARELHNWADVVQKSSITRSVQAEVCGHLKSGVVVRGSLPDSGWERVSFRMNGSETSNPSHENFRFDEAKKTISSFPASPGGSIETH